jgi:glycosyltransferase involved in cell wall biosynthesis
VVDEHQPEVSVLSPVYRPQRQFLLEAWESIHAQGDLAWEWVLQFDGSPAEMAEWLPDEIRDDPRCRPAAAGRFGVAITRNLGILRCRAPFVQCLDYDDILLPGAIAAALETMRADPELAFCFGDAVDMFPDGTFERRPAHKTLPVGRVEAGEISERYLAGKPHRLIFGSAMWRPEYVFAYGGWTALPVSEDFGLSFAVVARHPMAFIGRDTMHHRVHPAQFTSRPDQRRLADLQRPFLRRRLEAMKQVMNGASEGRPPA